MITQGRRTWSLEKEKGLTTQIGNQVCVQSQCSRFLGKEGETVNRQLMVIEQNGPGHAIREQQLSCLSRLPRTRDG